jgi:hypothetical protein
VSAVTDGNRRDDVKIKADLWLRNSGGSDLEVASVTTSYPGSAISSYSFPHLTDETSISVLGVKTGKP